MTNDADGIMGAMKGTELEPARQRTPVLKPEAPAPISVFSLEDLKGVLSTATMTVKSISKLMACLGGGKRLGPVTQLTRKGSQP
jgi:hypothetical protein